MNRAKKGFTIVELLIVIVVIAILAGLSTAVYSGITQRADNTARIAAAEQWAQLIKMYVAANGSVPPSIDALAVGTRLCLGTGFPMGGGGVPRCQSVNGTDANSPAESDSAQLLSELKTIGELPSNKPIPTAPGITGPWLSKPVATGKSLEITVALDGVFAIGDDCGGGFKGSWSGTRMTSCTKTIVF